ncbi:Protein CDV3 [Chionoecetes opilio]|uniref:Protein CDV3 n=1 Tax=Chionoecetes opilio TaxID=41210 RepID=A0A8J4YKT3_CHIOP|nr:Protein CDV3 [Chionoecetes opilio]
MADLDSFFARKDKKKVKGRKFTTTDEIAKRLEETEKKLEQQQHQGIKAKVEPLVKKIPTEGKQEDNTPEEVPVVEVNPKKEEEEWNDFKDEADKDLTDLKITKLQIEDEEEGGGGSADDDGEKGDHRDKKDGVWNTEKPPPPPPEPVSVPIPEPEEKSKLSQLPSSYVPPHMRGMTASPLTKNNPRRNRTAPDINNEMSFPSLSDAQAANPMGAWGKKKMGNEGFESVRHGSTRSYQEDYAAPKLSTANRFDALSDNS